MIASAVTLGWALFLVCMVFVAVHSARQRRISFLDWAVLGMGGVYGAGWSAVVQVTHRGDNPVWESWILPFGHLYSLHTAMALLLVGATCLGWALCGSLRVVDPEPRPGGRPQNIARWTVALWVLLGTAVVMQALYTRAYGGFAGLLSFSLLMRAGLTPVSNPLSFLQPFGGLALFASFGFFGLLLSRRRSVWIVLGLMLSVPFSLYVLYSWMGRVGFSVYLATFLLGFLLSRRPHPLTVLVGGGAVMVAVVIGAYYASLWLNLKASQTLETFVARELAFPFGSFFAQLSSGEHLARGFKDLALAPVYLLPSSLWTNWVEEVSQVNTAVIMGAPKGTQGITGGIPVDLLTLGLMQASLPGVVGIGMLFGGMLRILEGLLNRVPQPGIRAVLGAYLSLKVAVLGCFYSQPALVMSGNFDLIVSVLIAAVILKLPSRLWRAPLREPIEVPARSWPEEYRG